VEVAPMKRPCRCLVVSVLLLPAALLVGGGEKPGEKWLVDRDVTASPAAAPSPALKFRLYPSSYDRKDGNAVPLYLRFAHERSDAVRRDLYEKPAAWNKLPLDKLPLGEVKEFLDYHKYNLRQMELGARMKTADWNYTLHDGNPIFIRLPDVQEMRNHAQLLALKARAETAEGRFADAIRTIETGFSFSQQISEAPFLINGLVSIAAANMVTESLTDLIERPGAPNLYWAVSVVPRPLTDLKRAYEIEHHLVELVFPDLADFGRLRAAEEWDGALRRVRVEAEKIAKADPKSFQPPKAGNTSADHASKSPDLQAARKHLIKSKAFSPAHVQAMPPAEAILRHMALYYREIADEVFKTTYLPFPEARRLLPEAEKLVKAVPDTEAGVIIKQFLPAIIKVGVASNRTERKLALLRTIEALRMHAAASGGKLPEKLADVTVVPIPTDPGTGQPFEYKLDGATATLTSRIPGEPLATGGMRYRVTLRE
jgi:hypothetical protein